MLALTEGNVLVKTDATLGGAGGEIGLHVVCTCHLGEGHAAGFARDGALSSEPTARRVGAVANRCGGG